jgi:hypothetical protein
MQSGCDACHADTLISVSAYLHRMSLPSEMLSVRFRQRYCVASKIATREMLGIKGAMRVSRYAKNRAKFMKINFNLHE